MRALIALFATSLAVGFSGALMPGPLVTAAIAGAARDGFWVGPALSLGHAAAEAAVVVGLALGLGRLLKNRWVSGGIGVIGGLFLLWMGWDIAAGAWTGAVSLSLSAAEGAVQPAWAPVLTGVAVSLTNPYWIMWWATVGASYVMLGPAAGSRGPRLGLLRARPGGRELAAPHCFRGLLRSRPDDRRHLSRHPAGVRALPGRPQPLLPAVRASAPCGSRPVP